MGSMDWKERIKEIAEEVAEQGLGSSERYAGALLRKVKEEITAEAYPDEVRVAGGLVSVPELVAVKHLGGKFRDAWGREIEVDSVVVERGRIVGKGAVVFSTSKEDAIRRKYRFIAITPEEHEEIVQEIERYIYTDFEDIKDTPSIFATAGMGMRSDSPSAKWNAVADRCREREIERVIGESVRSTERAIAEFFGSAPAEVANKFVEYVGSQDGKFEVVKSGDDVFVRWVAVDGREMTKEAVDFTIMLEWFENAYGEIISYVEGKKRLLEALEGKEALVRIESEAGSINLRYDARRGELYVPSNFAGLVIGRKGSTIKRISEVVGRRVNVVKGNPASLGGMRYVVRIAGEEAFQNLHSEARGFLKEVYALRKEAGMIHGAWRLIAKEMGGRVADRGAEIRI